MTRQTSDAELELALGTPEPPTSLDDVYEKLVDLQGEVQTSNEHLQNILRCLIILVVLAGIALYRAW